MKPSTVTAVPAPPSTTDGIRWRRTRRTALVVVYGLLSLWLLAMSRGAVLALTGQVPDTGSDLYQSAYLHWTVSGWKLLSLGAVLVLCATAGRSHVAVQWLLVGHLCWLVAGVIAPDLASDQPVLIGLAVTVLIWAGPWFLLAPDRRRALSLRLRPDAALCVTWVVAAIPLLAWIRALSGADRLAPDQFDLVALPVTLLLVGGFAALRPRRRWWPASCVGITAIWVGVGALIWPTSAGSPGATWGAVTIAGGLVVLLQVMRRSRSVPDPEAGSTSRKAGRLSDVRE